MMQTLRKSMKLVMWIVALSFLIYFVLSLGMGGFKDRGRTEPGVIAVINGQKIQEKNYLLALDQEIESVKKSSGTSELPEYRIQQIREQVWQSTLSNILMNQEVRRLGITVSPDEIYDYLRYNPPDFIRSNEQLQTDGKFDIKKYQQALSDQNNNDFWVSVESYLRSSLPVLKLQQRIVSSVQVTESELRERYRIGNDKSNVKTLFFDANAVKTDNISVTDQEIESYYKTHKKDFEQPEKRKIRYVQFPIRPSQQDSAQTRTDIQNVLEQIESGSDFGEMAKEYSDDTGTAPKGGDLGFFGKGMMVKPFEDVAFTAPIGKVLGPVETQFGLHLIQVLARKTEKNETQVQARHILMKYKTSSETQEGIEEKAKYIYDEAIKINKNQFQELVQKEQIQLKDTPLFTNGVFVPGLGMAAKVNETAFAQELNWISHPINIENSLVIFQISEIQKQRIQSLSEARQTILNQLQMEKKIDKAGELCREVSKRIQEGQDFESASLSLGIQSFETGFFTLTANVTRIGDDPIFAGTAFKLNPGQISQPIRGTKGYYLIRMIERIPIKESDFQAQKEQLSRQTLKEKQEQTFMAWYNGIKKEASIKDYRNLYL